VPGVAQLRWGIISTGRIARVFANDLKATDSGRLVAVASRDLDRARAFGDATAYGSYDELLADDEVDAVYIATPHPMHARWAIRAAEAGKHVLCEKPLGMNLAEAQAVVEAARSRGVFLMEAFMYRCHPQTQALVDLLTSRAIGDVHVIEAVHSFRGPGDPSSRLLAKELGGGGILDVGCYCVSGARLVASAALGVEAADPVRVTGTGHIGATGVDEWAVGTLGFDGGIVAHLATGVRVDQPPRLAIYGSEGSIVLRAPWLPGLHGHPEIVVRRGRDEEVVRSKAKGGLYALEADVVARCVAAGERQAPFPACTWNDTLANARTLDRWRHAVGVTYEADKLPVPVRGGPVQRLREMPSMEVDGVALPVSRIALGTMVATGAETLPVALNVFDRFFESGGNTFDTAFIYANGWSERALGEWIATRGVRGEVVVLAKGAHTPDTFPDRIRPQLTKSFERMRIDRADLYMPHRDNLDIPVGEWVDALESLRREGLIGAYGGSNWTAARIDEANAWAREHDAAGFTVVSNQFSLARMHVPTWPGTLTANEPAFRAWLSERRITNFAWSSQAAGFFAGLRADGFLAHAWYFDDNLERRRRAVELASSLGTEPTTLALAWILHTGLPIVPIVGPLSEAELRTSLAALEIALTEEQVRWLDLGDEESTR
jgi:predicted dehydrogenase/aryl-alcohol dehydrogenase-like predicted oxidoreductase